MGEQDRSQARGGGSSGVRGPSYPFIDLKAAVERAHAFFENEGRAAAPILAAVAHWGYAEKSSGGKQTVSALIQYGLMRDEGSSEQRKVSLTRLAYDILLSTPGSRDHADALKRAARSPRIFMEVLTHYKDTGLPSDASLKHFLIADKELNVGAAETVIKHLRASIKYARLDLEEVPSENEGGVSDEIFPDRKDDGKDLAPNASGGRQQVLPNEPSVGASVSISAPGEREWLRGPMRKGLAFRLLVSGDGEVGKKEIGNLIKMLQAMQAVLSDDEDEL